MLECDNLQIVNSLTDRGDDTVEFDWFRKFEEKELSSACLAYLKAR